MTDRTAIILTYLALGIAAVITIVAFVIQWAVSHRWYSVEGTEIDRNIRRAAREDCE